MKILVIGGHGFIGSHLCKVLKKTKHKFYIYDVDLPTGDPNDVIKYNRRKGLPLSDSTFKEVDLVIHLGSFAGVRNDVITDKDYFVNNCLFLAKVLHIYRLTRIMYISSSSVLGDSVSPYSLSKQIAEEMVRMHSHQNLIIRPFSVYGEYGRPDMLITRCINKEYITVNGDPSEIKRYYTYVGDLVECMIDNLETEGGTINATGPKLYSIQNVLDYFHVPYTIGPGDERDFKMYKFDDAQEWICKTKLEDYASKRLQK